MALAKIGIDDLDDLDVKLGDISLRWRITFPTGDGGLTFPDNAYFIEPDINGNFTKAMVDDAVALGEKYIVFNADTLDVYYEDAPNLVGNDNRPV